MPCTPLSPGESAKLECTPAQELPDSVRCESHTRTRTNSAQHARHAQRARTGVAGASWCSASARIDAVTPEPQEHTSGRAGSTPAAVNSARSSDGGRSRPPATTCALAAWIARPCNQPSYVTCHRKCRRPHRWPEELAGDRRTCTAHQCTDGVQERANGVHPITVSGEAHARSWQENPRPAQTPAQPLRRPAPRTARLAGGQAAAAGHVAAAHAGARLRRGAREARRRSRVHHLLAAAAAARQRAHGRQVAHQVRLRAAGALTRTAPPTQAPHPEADPGEACLGLSPRRGRM